MAIAKQSKAKLKKRWFELIAPNNFGNLSLGEVPAYTTESIVGRSITVNLMNLTRDMRTQNVNVTFNVEKVMGDKAYTVFTGYQIMPSAIKRLVKRIGDKIEHVFNAESADNKNVTVKLLMVTRALVKNSVATNLRKKAEEFLTATLKKMKYDDFVSEVIGHKMQNVVKKELHKINPLRTCEIRQVKLIVAGKKPEFTVVEEVEEEKPKKVKKEKTEAGEEKPKKAKKEKKVKEITEEKEEAIEEAPETEEKPKKAKKPEEIEEV